MFYPVDSLKRGGRFYLCWVADSWPLRFAAITHRQLWSHDIRDLCQDLLEVMTNESGRPSYRFSLRLSSQLMRGLVRLYDKKVTVLLSDLCMINAHVFKTTNKKFTVLEVVERPQRALEQLPLVPAAVEEPENEQRIEEMIQNSANIVANIQDITLKEATIPDFQLPPNDGFGEENPGQPLQLLLADRTMEMMMAQDASGAQVSGLDLPIEGDRSHDKSRLAHDTAQMEMALDFDDTFRKSAGDTLPNFEKDIPEIPLPDLTVPDVPVPEIQVAEAQAQIEVEIPQIEAPEIVAETEAVTEKKVVPQKEVVPEREQVDSELEELEEQPQTRKRRAKAKLFVDKKIKIDSDVLRARIDNIKVELRCEDFTDDIIQLKKKADTLLKYPARSGMCSKLVELFQRSAGMLHQTTGSRTEAQDSEVEPVRQRVTRSHLEQIAEVQEPRPEEVEAPNIEQVNLDVSMAPQQPAVIVDQSAIEPEILIQDVTVNAPKEVDISDMPTQVLETLSQETRKRRSEDASPSKRFKSCDLSVKGSSQRNLLIPEIVLEEPDKENIPPNIQTPTRVREQPQPLPQLQPQPQPQLQPQLRETRDVSTMLQEAGIADIQQIQEREVIEAQIVQPRARTEDSDSTETPLGSLDRTKVSLGDSAKTTDSQRFIRNHWGIEGTMMKIISLSKCGGAVTLPRLLRAGPALPGHTHIIAAKCFTAILKLKQHGFVRVTKDPETLQLQTVSLGPKFDD